MLPISHSLLDNGHNVTFVGFDDTMQKIKTLWPHLIDHVMYRTLNSFGVALRKLVPKASMLGIGPSIVDREKMAPVQDMVQDLDYSVSQVLTSMVFPMITNFMGAPMALLMKEKLRELQPDVLCVSYAYPIFYALGEVLEVPVVGIGWGAPSFLTMQIDLPWATEPNIGSVHSREEIYDSPLLLAQNTLVPWPARACHGLPWPAMAFIS